MVLLHAKSYCQGGHWSETGSLCAVATLVMLGLAYSLWRHT
jgi:hypothetical protein